MIRVLRSSAGSGKTFNLAKTYIRLLLSSDDPFAYRHILAVTFTNKATAEMKNRILKELDILAREPQKSNYIEDFAKEFGGRKKVQKKASESLKKILHDYAAFSVSTIDKFFQQALRAFARELGQFSTYQIELDRKSLLKESSERVLESIGSSDEAKGVRKWLKDALLDQIKQDKKLSIEDVLHKKAGRLKSEELREVLEQMGLTKEQVFSREYLESVRKSCSKIISDYNKDASSCEQRVYETAKLLYSQIYTLGLAVELERQFKALLEEKNVISLDESNLALRNIIAGSDAPFIYEKLGVRFQDFLLDEFQDTSTIQWENFRPLLEESEATGGSNLVVGDVKQSIYRWRGGDWHLLAGGVKSDFPDADDSHPLKENWRSLRAIVEFNNAFFPFVARALDTQYGDSHIIQDIYADVCQEVCTTDKAPGYVKCTFCEGKKASEKTNAQLEEILRSVRDAQDAGAAYGQIAVLVRKNDEGSKVASYLAANGIPVISDDSMMVKSSVTVRRLVSLLYSVENKENRVNHYLAESLGIDIPDHYDSLYGLAEELLRRLKASDEALFNSEVLYIQSFMDLLLSWYSSNGNSLSAFLEYWTEKNKDDNKQIPMISSPEGVDAVRIMTIHKSKGLEFPYVIFPFAGKDSLFASKTTSKWCTPDVKGTALEGFAPGVFDVDMSSKTTETLFSGSFRKELLLQYIDNINTFYVALTRAEKVLHVIAPMPAATFTGSAVKKAAKGELPKNGFKTFAELLFWFTNGLHPDMGQMYDFAASKKEPADTSGNLPATFESWPIRGRMRVGGDAAELFSRSEGDVELPVRLKGIVMHKILADVSVARDLPAAVERAVAAGLVEASLAPDYLSKLRSAIDSVSNYHWFDDPSVYPESQKIRVHGLQGTQTGHPAPAPDTGVESQIIGVHGSQPLYPMAGVLNETGIIDADGSLYRPDRVVISPEGDVTVIDYKFGADHPAYAAQVRRYCRLFRDMGYRSVSGYLWFVSSSEVVPVQL